ncbi:hypothetical protein Pmani_038955 [Petrolisthes manimaculis]|uniref:Uncharacterized protein n=1 Tax=Petrolisthes manimaculis TaxID=1843537 RepID=A0AAE1NDD7_9EUCA|nr:hypothetical protein Pmani_038955 [Petrolisthes manimaculis]
MDTKQDVLDSWRSSWTLDLGTWTSMWTPDMEIWASSKTLWTWKSFLSYLFPSSASTGWLGDDLNGHQEASLSRPRISAFAGVIPAVLSHHYTMCRLVCLYTLTPTPPHPQPFSGYPFLTSDCGKRTMLP